ncbi:MAG: hypothetical protein Q4B65_00815 [Candidatus Saccharibacteria bacterium]|nr:hypothetical protein [Candidatus Saccharibacteria bacterium]
MLRTVTIVPTLTVSDKAEYKAQLEKINKYTKRIQVDITDGKFAKARTIGLKDAWWPKGWTADLHLMAVKPSEHINTILELNPSLCILHAEAQENLLPIFKALKERGIRTGVALLPTTYPGAVKPYIDVVDHVLIFAGKLGEQGGEADMMQMEKIPLIREMKPEVEIGWDGGANLTTTRALAHADLDVINVGSALSRAENPAAIYQALVAEIDKNGVAL